MEAVIELDVSLVEKCRVRERVAAVHIPLGGEPRNGFYKDRCVSKRISKGHTSSDDLKT